MPASRTKLRRRLRTGCLSLIGLLAALFIFGWGYSVHLAKQMERKNVLVPGSLDVAQTTDVERKVLQDYLRKAPSPNDYAVGKFRQHDAVILGETHEVREACDFISSLIEPMYRKAGVTCVAMECIKRKDTPLANRLVTGKTYDQELALRIFRDCGYPIWGFKEYIDILHAVWELNHELPAGAPRFTVIGLDNDWDACDVECGGLIGKLKVAAIESGRDKHMASVIGDEVLGKGKKALVQIGYMHSMPNFRSPAVKNGKVVAEAPARFGGILHRKYGDRVFQICLHQADFSPEMWTSDRDTKLRPMLGGLLQEMFTSMGNRPVGFDVAGSPFARLRDSRSAFYAYQKYVVFSDLAQGYVFLKPTDKLRKVTWAEGYIDDSIFQRARAIALKRGWIKPKECQTPESLDAHFRVMYEED